MLARWNCIVALTLLITGGSWTTRDFEIRWRHCNCTNIDHNVTERFECEIVEMPKRQGNFLNALLVLRHNVQKFVMEMSVSVPRAGEPNLALVGGQHQQQALQQLFKARIDGCRLMNYQSKNRILNAVLKKLIQSGNYPKDCPLRAHVNYTSRKYALNPDHFPFYMPDMRFITKFEFLADKYIPMFKATVEAEVTRRRTAE